jgi:aldose 1-epimerase
MIELRDGELTASIETGYGNNVRSLRLDGREFIWAEGGQGHLDGIPLLAPWANRIDGFAYWADGKRYLLNAGLENLRLDANGLPIHGLVLFTDEWKVVAQDARSVTSRLEVWRRADWMAQFPFAHSIEITHRLRDGALEVETAIQNHSTARMPLCIGFHPYFQLTDAGRDEWHVEIAARKQVALSDKLIPTGERKPVEFANPLKLQGHALDHVFTELTGEVFRIESSGQRIEVRFGSKYPVAVVYAPAGKSFVCIEPMTAFTNAFNLEHAAIKAELQSIEPGGTWRELFSVKPGM